MGGQVAVAHRGADPQPAVRGRLHLVVGQAADVHQLVGSGDPQAHQVNQVRAAAEVGGAGPEPRDGVRRVLCPGVGEGPHSAGLRRGHLGDRPDDVHVCAAPAQVAAHPLADLPGRQRRFGSQIGGDGTTARPRSSPRWRWRAGQTHAGGDDRDRAAAGGEQPDARLPSLRYRQHPAHRAGVELGAASCPLRRASAEQLWLSDRVSWPSRWVGQRLPAAATRRAAAPTGMRNYGKRAHRP